MPPPTLVDALFDTACAKFGAFVEREGDSLSIPPAGRPLTRMIATVFDAYAMEKTGHSAAV